MAIWRGKNQPIRRLAGNHCIFVDNRYRFREKRSEIWIAAAGLAAPIAPCPAERPRSVTAKTHAGTEEFSDFEYERFDEHGRQFGWFGGLLVLAKGQAAMLLYRSTERCK